MRMVSLLPIFSGKPLMSASGVSRPSRVTAQMMRVPILLHSAALVGLACLLIGCDRSTPDLPNRITLYLNAEPPSLNTITSEDNTSYQILDHVTEGLLSFNLDNQLVPGVAEKWEFDSRYGAVFHLRRDALWSDGTPVVAKDFVFAWQQAVNPQQGSAYAYILYPVKNAEAISKGQLPVGSLGVSALDDHTLKVDLERPTPYFLSLTAFSVYRPVSERFFRRSGSRYASDADQLLYNGPFTIGKWVHGAELVLVKNARYWNRAKVSLQEIAYPYFTSDPSTALNLYRDGKIQMADLGDQQISVALREHFLIRAKEPGVLNFLLLNSKPGRATRSPTLRRALQSAVDPVELTGRIIGRPGVEPTSSLFPTAMRRRFLDNSALSNPIPTNIEPSLAVLNRIRRELGVDVLPSLSLLVSDDPATAKLAEYLQRRFAERLSITVKIDRQTFKQVLAKTNAAQYDIVLRTWAPDFDDPLAYANVLLQPYADGSPLFDDPDTLHALSVASTSSDPRQRNAAFQQLDARVADQVPLIPLFVTGGSMFSVYVQDPLLLDVRRSNIAGDPNFNYARLDRR